MVYSKPTTTGIWWGYVWWFGTFGLFVHFIYGMASFPLTFIFFKMIIAPPTRHVYMCQENWVNRWQKKCFEKLYSSEELLCGLHHFWTKPCSVNMTRKWGGSPSAMLIRSMKQSTVHRWEDMPGKWSVTEAANHSLHGMLWQSQFWTCQVTLPNHYRLMLGRTIIQDRPWFTLEKTPHTWPGVAKILCFAVPGTRS
jgi:hypothetical protein